MNDEFYKAFLERFHGTRDAIAERLSIYLPFVVPHSGGKALDLGCGRGEWLEMLQRAGLDAQGVDLDENILAVCDELGLKAERGDALTVLRAQADESLAVVSALHLVEHLSPDSLLGLVQDTLRVLVPGGLLIMETPNPENIQVAATHFYRDPTHQRPVPPQLLSFLTEHAGFYRSKVVRSNVADIVEPVTLERVIKASSPDYSVVAQKRADADFSSRFDEAFGQEYGMTLDTLLRRFESRLVKIESSQRAVDLFLKDNFFVRIERYFKKLFGEKKE